ncbi:hypothetical protein SEA_SHAM4_64 [Mycobacterium phage Sham4]|nr:hypothetical protein SEA_SNAPE_64 [Mycobacterium phage Snape]QBI97892.1 hypothetical protein SEA_ORANGE_63 [Mycobacterium phage Orange]QBI98233.1 hypothetical protein SEA_BOWTIE_65 [Mycobacterium phage Bowtie]QGJ91358.1 hypothetical protein SEA_BACHOME_66 [Mycobacterium phage Bachome]QHJ86573.1 hypothetical protein SEA_MABEL_64 [Mycobacterium phage Mabel]QPX61989.1 membrane protein [Mycobacterium phage Flaverint]UAW08935.1 membrane protein [Mycobacterium phage Lucivia]UAW09321.1 membrane 
MSTYFKYLLFAEGLYHLGLFMGAVGGFYGWHPA